MKTRHQRVTRLLQHELELRYVVCLNAVREQDATVLIRRQVELAEVEGLLSMCGHITEQRLLLNLIHHWATSGTEPCDGEPADGKREAAQRRYP
jgi:hypothetical protein